MDIVFFSPIKSLKDENLELFSLSCTFLNRPTIEKYLQNTRVQKQFSFHLIAMGANVCKYIHLFRDSNSCCDSFIERVSQ
jgi:hypothetical protein